MKRKQKKRKKRLKGRSSKDKTEKYINNLIYLIDIMALKLIDVDELKWNRFKKWCVLNDTTMKDKLDEYLTQFLEEIK